MSALWDPIFGRTAATEVTGDRAWLAALCDAEAALARACARHGLISAEAAAAVQAACARQSGADPAELGRLAAADGNPVIGLVERLRAELGDHATAVHFGATSQDLVDTAMMLISRRAGALLLATLAELDGSCRRLAEQHRDTTMIGRTLLQQAVPTTFGAVVAGWGEGLRRVTARLAALHSGLPVQLGGAAGTMAGWYPHGPAVRASFAAELGLADPGTVWHTERSRIAELAGALGAVCGAVGKAATDVVLLAQTEVGELSEQAGGASSAMAHKHNPIAAVTARASALQAPGLVSGLLAAMPGELQRAAGAWHAEWLPLIELWRVSCGAAERLSDSLAGLQVHSQVMAANLRAAAVPSGIGHAGDLVDGYLAGGSTDGNSIDGGSR